MPAFQTESRGNSSQNAYRSKNALISRDSLRQQPPNEIRGSCTLFSGLARRAVVDWQNGTFTVPLEVCLRVSLNQ